MATYNWPRTGTPLTDTPLLQHAMHPDDWATCTQARRAKWYLNAAVFRDPTLDPHTPRRAADDSRPS